MTSLLPRIIGGVDTHSEFHVAAVVHSATGKLLGTERFDATPSGYEALLAWMASVGTIDGVGIEGTGAYGAGLARLAGSRGLRVVEVDRPDRQARRRQGKTDTLDAEQAARAVLSERATAVPKSGTGSAEALRVIEVTCHSAIRDRTRAINQFKALLITAPAGLRVSMNSVSFRRQVDRANRFSDRHDDLVERHTRFALKELARRIIFVTTQTEGLQQRMNDLAAEAAPALLGLRGVGPQVTAQLLAVTGDNPHRLGSEAAFAKLCGACPIPASSGHTTRHRLNRGGDRRGNNALHTIVLVRMRHDGRTQAYVKRRVAEGKTKPEIMRCLKRFVAREIYQAIINPPSDLPTGPSLRTRRNEAKKTLTQAANATQSTPIQVSRLERGIDHNNELAALLEDWLTTS